MAGKNKGASEGKKKPPYTTKKGVEVPKVAAPAMCKKCGKPYGKGPGKCTC